MTTATAPLLDVQNLSISFGGLKAVQDFTLRMPAGALYGLIGPNGAGKTTVFNLLTGVYVPQSGSITLADRSVTGRKPHEITACGMARTFQNIRLFPDLSVLENVLVAMHLRGKHGLPSTFLRSSSFHVQEHAMRDRAIELLTIFELEGRRRELARNLPYGHQRQLEIVRALATGPRVLLLDEPAAGMNSQEKVELAAAIRQIREQFGVSILLIEHDMGLVMQVCERIIVLDYGETIAEGTPHEVQNNPKVIEAYLGTTENA